MKPIATCHAFVHGEMVTVASTMEGRLSSLTFAVKELYDVQGFGTGARNPAGKTRTKWHCQTRRPSRCCQTKVPLCSAKPFRTKSRSLDGEHSTTVPDASLKPLPQHRGSPSGISLLGARGQDGQLLAATQFFGTDDQWRTVD